MAMNSWYLYSIVVILYTSMYILVCFINLTRSPAWSTDSSKKCQREIRYNSIKYITSVIRSHENVA